MKGNKRNIIISKRNFKLRIMLDSLQNKSLNEYRNESLNSFS